MKTSSCKAKGRKLQQFVRDALLAVGARHTLQLDDIRSTSMGANGVDVQMSPAAAAILGPLAVECKNQQTLSVVSTFLEHAEKYPNHIALLVHKRNRQEPLVTLKFSDYLNYLRIYSDWRANHQQQQ